MGNQPPSCIRQKDTKLAQNMFKVRNVDDKGSEVQRAIIEVTKTDIMLHQRGKESIKWPLRSLRRYGFEKKLFSFESGRRCATGPGIYAFKCKRAEFLFLNVQENAQACGNVNGRFASSYSASESINEGSPAHQSPTSPVLSAFSTDVSSLGESHNGSAYGLASYTGRTLSTSSSIGGALTPPPPPLLPSAGNSMHYINANSFPDIPESPLENENDSSSVTPTLISHRQEDTVQTPSEDDDPNVNYARLRHDINEDSSPISFTETDALTSTHNDVNGNKDNSVLLPLSAVTPTKLPESYYMKPSTIQDIVNGNAVPPKSMLNSNGSVNATGLVDATSEAGSQDCHSNRASPLTTTTPSSLVSQYSLTTPGSKTSGGSSYYANLDTVGELPHSNFVFCCDLRSPCSTSSSKGSGGSEFIFDTNLAGNRSPVSEHSYANLDALSEVGMRSAVCNSNVILQPAPKGHMNYADLDIESLEAVQTTPTTQARQSRSSSLTSSPPKTPASLSSEGSSRRTDTYAMIDFNRTTALANSQRQIDDSDLPGGPVRRTRHDSKMR